MPFQATQASPVKNKKGNLILVYMLSAVVLLGGLALLIGSFLPGSPAAHAVGLTAQELSTGTDYFFTELMVVDPYASDVADEDNMYIYVAFFDAKGKAYLASFAPEKDPALLEQLWAYVNDTSAYIGDVSFPAVVAVQKLSVLDDDARRYYKDSLDDYMEIFREAGFDVEGTELHFKYLGADQPAYEAHQAKEAWTMRIIGALFLLLGLFMTVYFPRNLKKRWEKMAAMAAEQSVVNVEPQPAPSVIKVVSLPREEAPSEEE